MDSWVVSIFLATMNKNAMNIHVNSFSENTFLFLLDYYLTKYFIELHSNKTYGSLKKYNLLHVNETSAIYSFSGNFLFFIFIF